MEKYIDIENKQYVLSTKGYYPLILFKRKTGKSTPNHEDLEELITFIHCYLTAYNKEFKIELEEFFMVCDDDIIKQFSEFLIEANGGDNGSKKKVVKK